MFPAERKYDSLDTALQSVNGSICQIVLMLALLLHALPALAERPRIGLALAGGGAKGAAHIAVIELLEANNIPVDYIAGTSIGAYVGGLYALGYKAAEIRKIMFEAELSRGYSDAIDREDLPYRIKRQKDKFNVPVDIGYRDRQARFPGGLLYGQTMSAIYRRSIGNIANLDSFDDLPIPFRALATDLSTGESVVLDSGNLIKALQASATVPGALVPVELNGRYLVDGGLTQNIPISQVQQMGAEIVIAVDITSPLLERSELDNALAVMRQLSRFLTVRDEEYQRELLGENDVYIRPDVDQLSTTDFTDLPKAYEAGRIAAANRLTELMALSVDADDYLRYQREKKNRQVALRARELQPVVEIVLLNRSSLDDRFLLDTLGLSRGKTVTTEELLAAVKRLYALDRFERVDAEFVQRQAGRTLIIEAREKSWGPNHFEMGLGWEDDFTLDSVINIDFAYSMGNITDNNGEWRNEIGMGTNKTFASEVYLPLDTAQLFYHSTRYRFRRESQDSFIENQLSVIYEVLTHRVDLGLGYRFAHSGVIETGITYESGDISDRLLVKEDLLYDSGGLYLKLGYDTLDRLSFPTRGNRFNLSIFYRDEDAFGELINGTTSTSEPYRSTQYLADWKGAVSRGNHGLVGKASFAYLDSEADQSVFYAQLGGFLNLSGYHKNALVGNHKAFGALSYQFDLGKSLLGLKGFPLYVGASIEVGNVWLTTQSVRFSDLITAGSIFVGTDTKLGPIALAIGAAEGNNNAVYFYLGKNI